MMRWASLALLCAASFACGGDGDDDSTEADRVGVGAACSDENDCREQSDTDTEGEDLVCLLQFAGGYCGLEDCSANDDCPEGAACVAHSDGVNYCFRRCQSKSECNANRPVEAESNCSANVTFVEPATSGKACVPPSSGG